MANKEDFFDQLKAFIDKHKNDKIHNTAVKQDIYDKLFDRKLNNKRTNIKAITSIEKICQYYLAGLMIGDRSLTYNIESYIFDGTNYEYKKMFINIFSEVEFELPDRRVIKNPRIEYNGDKFLIYDGADQFEAICDEDVVTYKLMNKPFLDGNCWEEFENIRKAPIGTISSNLGWKITGTVILDKVTGDYKVSDITFLLNSDLSGLSIVARYSGLHRSAWVSISDIGYSNKGKTIANYEWDGSDIKRGRIYLCKGHNVITSVTGDWDGYYNNISFEKLKALIESI